MSASNTTTITSIDGGWGVGVVGRGRSRSAIDDQPSFWKIDGECLRSIDGT